MTIRKSNNNWGFILIMLIVIILSGCSAPRPDILEPSIKLSEATDISRTEATITTSINRRGDAKLSYLSLFYCEEESSTPHEISGNPKVDLIDFHITGLKPGTTYSCYIEGGTATATLRSNSISFTTLPNEPPKLSSPTPLSTGPLGIIVEFSILEDGGEPIHEAGCEIRETGMPESRRVYLQKGNLSQGTWQLNITGLMPLKTYSINPFATNSTGEAYGESLDYTTKNSIVLMEAGHLTELFGRDSEHEFECLTISGPMNGDDFRTLRQILGAPDSGYTNLSGIKTNNIDLTDVDITEGGSSYDGHRFTVDDELTTDIFADCALLHNATLPNTATTLARDAFARCGSLESFTISSGIKHVLPSAGCVALKEINVSKANRDYSSIDGVLFDYNATEIVWFPHGKTGDYQLPESITTIGENAFAETSITKLTIPSSVTTISRGAFADSALTEILLPETITNISEGMFQNCLSLSTVYLGSGTKYIGDFAFDHTSLKKLFLAATIPPFTMEEAFINGDTTIFEECILYVPTESVGIYRNHNRWGRFRRIEGW